MRNAFWTLCLALALASAATQGASAGNVFDAGVELVVPVGALNDYWDLGMGASGSYLFELSPFTAAGVSFGYHRCPLDKGAFTDGLDGGSDAAVDGGALSVMTLCGEFRLKSGAMDRAVVFGFAGVGFDFVKTGDLTIAEVGEEDRTIVSDTQVRLGGYFGGGFGAPLNNKVKLGLDARAYVFTVEDEPQIGELDSSLTFLSLRALVMIGL